MKEKNYRKKTMKMTAMNRNALETILIDIMRLKLSLAWNFYLAPKTESLNVLIAVLIM